MENIASIRTFLKDCPFGDWKEYFDKLSFGGKMESNDENLKSHHKVTRNYLQRQIDPITDREYVLLGTK